MPAPPRPAISSELTGEPGRAHVLDGDDVVGLHELEAGLEQELLGERIARPAPSAASPRRVASNSADASRLAPWMPSRPVREPTYMTGLPDARRRRAEDAVARRDAEREGVHQDVVVVARVEVDLAADGRHADAVAVVPDAADDAAHEVRRARVVEAPKRSESRLAIGRAPMVKMSRRMPPTPVAAPWNGSTNDGMVVALDLEDRGEPVADVDRAGVLARALQHLRARRRQLAQVARASSCRSSAPTT